MLCTTVRNGSECHFMTKKGCSYNGGSCQPVVPQCEGCSRAAELESGTYCTVFPEPLKKWKTGNCNMATHIKAEPAAKAQKINPIKASKRGKH